MRIFRNKRALVHAESFGSALRDEFRYRVLRDFLLCRIERRVHGEALVKEAVRADRVLELRDHVGREIRILVRHDAAVLSPDQLERLRICGVRFFG